MDDVIWNHRRIPGRGEAMTYVVLSNHRFYEKDMIVSLETKKILLRLKQKFGFIKRVDKGEITTVKDLESWRFER